MPATRNFFSMTIDGDVIFVWALLPYRRCYTKRVNLKFWWRAKLISCTQMHEVKKVNLHNNGLMRKLRNSKFGQGWGIWFVGGNSDSPSSEEAQISNNIDYKWKFFFFFKPRNSSKDEGDQCYHPPTENLKLNRIWSYGVSHLAIDKLFNK